MFIIFLQMKVRSKQMNIKQITVSDGFRS